MPHSFLLALLLASAPSAQSRFVFSEVGGWGLLLESSQATISADGRHVLVLPQPSTFSPLVSAPMDLHGEPVQLSAQATALTLTRDGEVYFREGTSGASRLMRAPSSGSTAALEVLPGTLASSYSLSKDESLLAVTETGSRRIHCLPRAGGGTPVVVTAPVDPLRYLWLTDDGSRVLFFSKDFANDGISLSVYSAPTDGSAQPMLLHQASPGDFFEIGVSTVTSQARLLLRNSAFRLFSVPSDGSAPAVELTAGIAPSGGAFHASPDGAWVAFGALSGGQVDARIAPSDGSVPSRRLNAPLVPGGSVDLTSTSAPRNPFTADSGRYVYRADQDVDDREELFSVPVDGSAPPLRLNGTLPAGGEVQGCEVTADTPARLVFRADMALDALHELWTVPVDGSEAPRRLNSALPPGGVRDVHDFRLSRDRRTVLYLANEDGPLGVELHTVASDGSLPDERLSSIQRIDNPLLEIGGYSERASSVVFLREEGPGSFDIGLYVHRAPHVHRR